jgi:iron(III) transport system substrate-binding protein
VNKISRRVFLGTGAAAATVAASQLITSCTNSTKQINLYSSRHYNTDTQLYDDFTKQTGIKVNVVEGEADQLLERIKSEGASGPADVFVTVDVARLWRAEEAGIFAPINSSLIEQRIPKHMRHPQGYWFGFAKRSRVIMYNKERVKPSQLSTYEDLADPKWKGKLVVRPANNTYNQSLVASIIVADGEQAAEKWCRGIVANLAQPPQGNDVNRIEAVASGVADLTLANTYYFVRFAKSKEKAKQEVFQKVGVFFPNQNDRGAHVNISGAGLVKTSPNKEEAIQFLEFLTSDTAQVFLTKDNYEYPAVESLSLDPILASFGTFKSDLTDIAAYGPNLAKAVEVMARAGWK